jgi:transposase
MEQQDGQWIGIDVAKRHLDVQVGETGSARRYPNTPGGHRRLVTDLRRGAVAGVVLEATGTYHRALVAALTAGGFPPAVLNPQWLHAFKRSEGQRVKTDRTDARLLARYGAQKHPRPARPVTAAEQALRALVARREELVITRAAEKNRCQVAPDPGVAGSIAAHLAWLDGEIARLDAAIDAAIATTAPLAARRAVLRSMPGIGPVTSAVLVAFLPELDEMDRRQVAAIVGLAPYAADSGSHQGQRRIGGGRAAIRRVLYQAALAASRADPTLRDQKQRMRAAGKAHKVIIVAIARRMLGILTAMVREDLAWEETRMGQGAYRRQAAA